MRCPRLAELPSPPIGATGWPWTVESPQHPDAMPGGERWPRISIVTPSYNQGRSIEETIRSVLLQGYPDLEYFIMDGGSADGTVETIRKYSSWLTSWSSEPDRGQAHAINKGYRLATGDIFQWINSDDILCHEIARRIAHAVPANGILATSGVIFGNGGEQIARNRNLTLDAGLRHRATVDFFQPGIWLSREAAAVCFPLDEKFHYAFDVLMIILCLAARVPILYSDIQSVRFRVHPASKSSTSRDLFFTEGQAIILKLLKDPRCAEIRPLLMEKLRRIEWREELEAVTRDKGKWHILKSLMSVLSDPRVRLNRFSVSRLVRMLFVA